MRRILPILLLAGCTPATHAPQRPMSAAEHYAEARAHDDEAAAQDQAAFVEHPTSPEVVCGNRTLSDQSTSGGVPITQMVPCWTRPSARDAHLHRAHKLRRDARVHREIAAQLIRAEQVACDVIPPSERDHSPSWHRDDIASVEAVRDGGPVRGARVVFRKVEGLSPTWLMAAYKCHQAQAAVEGFDPTFMAYCPAGLADITIEAAERADGFVVTFRSDRPEIAAALLGRASDLVEQ